MKVKDIREYIENLPDDTEIYIEVDMQVPENTFAMYSAPDLIQQANTVLGYDDEDADVEPITDESTALEALANEDSSIIYLV